MLGSFLNASYSTVRIFLLKGNIYISYIVQFAAAFLVLTIFLGLISFLIRVYLIQSAQNVAMYISVMISNRKFVD